ncbi:putative protein LONGIFOLIA [Helianthus annuus]|nr:putative protein LONGIFOLIA [Helianthus annuus]KAJ0509822.1 putative protein LONGIFOLIA [Helianthus annuus]KAJ0685839.1 putative protein LONGIFOLIA [Helianthus annuus]KAJ0689711.1 putative protein LONGIFOLIA [Helianthus annuus]
MMRGVMQDQNHENQIEKQIGCMSGFLHIFDRQQILAGKRIHSAKRHPTSAVVAVSPESINLNTIRETEKPVVVTSPESESLNGFPPSPVANLKFFPTSTPPRSPLPLPIFEGKNSWKFCKEMPRLSLDSRATIDSKGSLCPREIRPDSNDPTLENQGRSPSVIARLMGLEQLPSSSSVLSSSPEPMTKPELRRSASESRVATNLFNSGFIDRNNLQTKQPNQTSEKNQTSNPEMKYPSRNISSRSQQNESSPLRRYPAPPQRRIFFDSTDFFPEPKQKISKNLNMKLKRVDEQSKDLEALKNILEALQLKGLLHSINRDNNRNFVYDNLNVIPMNRRHCHSPVPNRRYSGDISPRTERGVFDRSGRSLVRVRNSAVRSRIELNSKNSNANDKRKPLSIQTGQRCCASSESPRNSPKLAPKKSGSEHRSAVASRSPRSKRPTEKVYLKHKVCRTVVVEDESTSFSESSGSTTSQFDVERSKMEEYKEGKSLLARCDKLLAEMNSITESHTSSSNSVLPSPVSVLDPAFDKDESLSPSPVMKRTIDFKDLADDLDDDIWSSPATPTEDFEEFISGDSDFKYISEILRASKYLPVNSSAFLFLEKQQSLNENDSSNSSKLQRKLVFDVVTEILNHNKDLPPSLTKSSNTVKKICSEFQKIREPETAENLLDQICSVLKKDLAGDNGWGDHPVEISEAVLYIERLIFKDLVSETIRELALFLYKRYCVRLEDYILLKLMK